MMSLELPTSGVNINLTDREFDLMSNALLVRVKTFRASIEKMKKMGNDDIAHILEECEKDEWDTYILLRKVAELQGISLEVVEHQLSKNPWMKKD